MNGKYAAIGRDAMPKQYVGISFDLPVIIRLQASLLRSVMLLAMIVAWGSVLWWQEVAMPLVLPFMLLVGHAFAGAKCLPMLKLHRQDWWCFIDGAWREVNISPRYIGTWYMAMAIEGQSVTVWLDSCGRYEQWVLRQALLARERAKATDMPERGVWTAFWRRLLG